MIPNQWYVVLESQEVPRRRPVGVTRMGEKLVFWRDGRGGVVCQRDLCPHRGVALSTGKLTGDCVQCPFHGFEFDASGRCRLIPAIGKNGKVPEALRVHTYPACEAHGYIYIYWGEPEGALPPVPFFDDITADFTYASARDPWNTHYSRAIENQLDVVHLPFVHATTIGRGGRAVVDGPVTRWITENHLRVYVYNRVDDGKPPRKAEELGEPTGNFWVEVLLPNLWQNHLGDDSRIVVAFVPVDEEHSLLYLRFYQRFLTWPIVSGLVNRLAMPLNMLILHQDRRVVVTQRPLRTWLRMGEKLIQGDGPIIAYRRRRDELIAGAQAHEDQVTEAARAR
jgi:phenylpropionate dioxygenase-like ring-hydroxylating dioxygenase large terminal subunit